MEPVTLDALVQDVKVKRELLAASALSVKGLRAAWEQEFADTLAAAAQAKDALAASEAALKESAVLHFEATGDRIPCAGVEVKVFTVREYDTTTAFAWALEHKMALALDSKAFDAVAKATALPFVVVREEARAQIASAL